MTSSDSSPPRDQTQVSSAMASKISPYASGESMERFARTFETSARRWELVVYPSLFAFIILAAYGFYLIYSLTSDVALLAKSVDTNMGTHMEQMTGSIRSLSNNMDTLTSRVEQMTGSVDHISQKVDTLEPMLTNMAAMTHAVQIMAATTDNIRRDMSVMNQNVSRPMSFMNTFMPW
jgi:methyl-accepting chemotaxis protein